MAATKQKKNEADALATALGLSSKTVTVRGETVTVEEFEIEQLPLLLGMVKGLIGKAMADKTANRDAAQDLTSAMLMESGEVGIQFAMVATGKPREWFKKLPLGDGLALYSAVIGANESFFAQMDQFTELIELVSGLFAPAAKATATSGQSTSQLSTEEVLRLVKSEG
jgi:hypothetical protein